MRSPILHRRRGVAALEMAFLLVPLILFAFGVTEFGRAFHYYNTLLKSTRDASRHMSMLAPGGSQAAAKCLAVYGNANCSGDPVVPGLTQDMVEIVESPSVPTGAGSINLVTVTISGYKFTSLMPLVPVSDPDVGTPGDFQFGAVATTMRQASS